MIEIQEEAMTTEEIVEGYLVLGKIVVDQGNFEQAEHVYKSALSIAEREAGEDNAIVGLVLIELWDLYENSGREKEAQQIWERICGMIRSYHFRQGAEKN